MEEFEYNGEDVANYIYEETFAGQNLFEPSIAKISNNLFNAMMSDWELGSATDQMNFIDTLRGKVYEDIIKVMEEVENPAFAYIHLSDVYMYFFSALREKAQYIHNIEKSPETLKILNVCNYLCLDFAKENVANWNDLIPEDVKIEDCHPVIQSSVFSSKEFLNKHYYEIKSEKKLKTIDSLKKLKSDNSFIRKTEFELNMLKLYSERDMHALNMRRYNSLTSFDKNFKHHYDKHLNEYSEVERIIYKKELNLMFPERKETIKKLEEKKLRSLINMRKTEKENLDIEKYHHQIKIAEIENMIKLEYVNHSKDILEMRKNQNSINEDYYDYKRKELNLQASIIIEKHNLGEVLNSVEFLEKKGEVIDKFSDIDDIDKAYIMNSDFTEKQKFNHLMNQYQSTIFKLTSEINETKKDFFDILNKDYLMDISKPKHFKINEDENFMLVSKISSKEFLNKQLEILKNLEHVEKNNGAKSYRILKNNNAKKS